MSERDKPDKSQANESGFRITQRRAPESDGFTLRRQLLDQTFDTIRQLLTEIPNNRNITSMDLPHHHQQAPNTCLLACSISTAEALSRRLGVVANFDETGLRLMLEQQHLITPVGLDTIYRKAEVIKFFETNLGLPLVDVPTREPAAMGSVVVDAITHGEVIFLNSASHWIALFGLRKDPSGNTYWNTMNPARQSLDEIALEALVNMLVGDPRYSPTPTPGLGVRGELLRVAIPPSGFRVISRRTGTR